MSDEEKVKQVRELANDYLSHISCDPAAAQVLEEILEILNETGDQND